jgi:hypothetical protein
MVTQQSRCFLIHCSNIDVAFLLVANSVRNEFRVDEHAATRSIIHSTESRMAYAAWLRRVARSL